VTPKDPTAGWVVAVMVAAEEEPTPLRRYFAVGRPDQQRAEWAAVDAATALGRVAASPVAGNEPVEAVAALPGSLMKRMGLADGAIRPLGEKLPRRWMIAGK